MKKIIIFITLILCISTFVWAGGARSTGIKVPRVNYIKPENESEVDLRDKEHLTFEWKPTPIPQGGRRAYRFALFKDYKYDMILTEDLHHKVLSIDVPKDMFEEGQSYTWRVKQRAWQGGGWSAGHRWSLTVKK